MLLHYDGKFLQTKKRSSQQGSRALSSLLSSLQQIYATTEQKLFLFDSMVGSVLSYTSEIWVFHCTGDSDLIFYCFCSKYILQLGKIFLQCFYMVKLDICLYIFFVKRNIEVLDSHCYEKDLL